LSLKLISKKMIFLIFLKHLFIYEKNISVFMATSLYFLLVFFFWNTFDPDE